MTMNDIKFKFTGKTALVVGGSRGIGREVVRQFVLANATTFYASRRPGDIASATHLKCDIRDSQDISEMFSRLSSVDYVINVAGTNLCEPIEMIDEDEWSRVIDTNLKSFFLICQHAIKMMKNKNYGRIVNVSSIAGRHKSIVSGVHYTSSKYGIVGLTKQLAHEVSSYNIRVNCTCPSQTLTEMLEESMTKEEISLLESRIPVRRISTVTEQALPILFLCSHAADYINGATLDVNGGQL